MKSLIGSFLILFSMLAWSQSPQQKTVEIEWEVVSGAKSYEIEIISEGQQPVLQRVNQNLIRMQMNNGEYQFRVRAIDLRGIRSDWSEPESLNLNLQAIKKDFPAHLSAVNSSSEDQQLVELRWQPQDDVESYEVTITSLDGTIQEVLTVSGSSLKKELPVGKTYAWKVRALTQGALTDDNAFTFTLIGKALDKPEIESPSNQFVRDLEWKTPSYADSFRFLLQRQNRKTKKWEKVLSEDNYKDNSLVFDGKLPGGTYRLLVVAKAPLRQPSPTANLTFNVKSGDRSPAAEETFEVRQSIDRLSAWFSSVSYLMTVFDYKSTNFDRANSSVSYSAVGATGRIGLGYLRGLNNWGFHGIFDISGISVENKTTTFASTELNAVRRQKYGRFGEIRNNVGVYYKELPETVSFASTQSTETELVKVLGPHYGFEYWRALDSQFGIQANAHIYLPLVKVKTPNEQALQMTPSWQLGLLGSYRWQRNITALLGYAYRLDQVKYKALPGAVNGDTNDLSMAGHYINFYLEWDM
jgi:hypothetical protein